MNKRIITSLMSVVVFSSIIGTTAPALAASGNWRSVTQWDANGVSETGAVNRTASL